MSILDHPAISGRYLFPQDRTVDNPFVVKADCAELACYRRIVDPNAHTIVHFHENGEAVADYVLFMADVFADLGLNSRLSSTEITADRPKKRNSLRCSVMVKQQ